MQLRTDKLFQAEQAAFHYSELSMEYISSALKECTGFVVLENVQDGILYIHGLDVP